MAGRYPVGRSVVVVVVVHPSPASVIVIPRAMVLTYCVVTFEEVLVKVSVMPPPVRGTEKQTDTTSTSTNISSISKWVTT